MYRYYDYEHTYPRWFLILNGLYERTVDGIRWFCDREVYLWMDWWHEIESEWRKNNHKMSNHEARKAYGLIREKPDYVTHERLDREEILARVDMEALVGSICSGEGRRFANRMVFNCPFHSDFNASFTIFLDKKRWWCFGCSEGGTAFDLIMKAEDLNFIQAMTRLDEMF